MLKGNSKDDEQLINEEFDKIDEDLNKLKFYIENEKLILSKSLVECQNLQTKTCNQLFKDKSSNSSVEEILRVSSLYFKY